MSTYINGAVVAMGYESGLVKGKTQYKSEMKYKPSTGTNIFFMSREELEKHMKEMK